MKAKALKKPLTKKSNKPAVKKKKRANGVVAKNSFKEDFEVDADGDNEIQKPDMVKKRSKRSKKEDANSDDSDLDPTQHKKSLMKLKDTDPEFYSYLQENDKNLLEFNLSDDDESTYDESETRHIPDTNLEVASDESDFEAEDTVHKKDGATKVTLHLIKTWQNEIQNDKSSKSIKNAVEAFHAALQTVAESDNKKSLHYKVEGSAVFNGVVQLCIFYLPDAFKRFLKIGSGSHFEAHKSRKFPKVRNLLKTYLTDLVQILQSVTSANIVMVLLKHLHQMLPYTQSFSSLTKPLLRILLKLWSSGEESVRVVAFLCILRIATSRKESVLELLLKAMYVKYVENAKFVSPTTLPGINFMRHSLVEIYLLDNNLSYSHAFLYIRQLAIHLRNAMTLKKKENFQAVYNWQYINSLQFWSELIYTSKNQSPLRSLLYPLVQIVIGTIKVIPTAQYYPLRFHCAQMLTNISKETNTFIPILPFLLEILDSYDFNKRHKTVSMKPLPLICVLRMSKSQLQENGFKDSVIETVYQLILENAAKDSHAIYFPDLYVPCVMQLKAFLKKCHVANYCRKMKQLLEKIEENRKFIETERAKQVFDLKNTAEIANWENRIRTESTSLAKFYASWIKVHQSRKLKLLTKNDEEADLNLPTVRKPTKQRLDEGDSGDSDDESDFEMRIKGAADDTGERKAEKKREKRKTEKPTKKRKKPDVTRADDDDNDAVERTDIVRDARSDDWD